MSDTRRADMADLFLARFEQKFGGIVAACERNGPEGSWQILDEMNPEFLLEFDIIDCPDGSLVLEMSTLRTGPKKAAQMLAIIEFAADFIGREKLSELVIGSPFDDEVRQAEFTKVLCERNAGFKPAKRPGYVRLQAH